VFKGGVMAEFQDGHSTKPDAGIKHRAPTGTVAS
jgi:hypothetical protein